MSTYEKRGYLNSDFKLFHLSDVTEDDVEFHYHDFDKIMIFIKGNVNYIIEGKSYHLEPYDIVLVNHHDIHKPVIDTSVSYERIIVYLSPSFITSYQTDNYDLSDCFSQAKKKSSDVLRVASIRKSSFFRIIRDLEYACSHTGYANELYCQTLFLEFMIQLNRAARDSHVEYISTGSGSRKILQIMEYIHKNLTSDITIDILSSSFYISRYHLMRMFRQETGYTISGYINEKRLLLARELLAQNKPITEICYECGFRSYSAFLRAYKKLYRESPASYRKSDKS